LRFGLPHALWPALALCSECSIIPVHPLSAEFVSGCPGEPSLNGEPMKTVASTLTLTLGLCLTGLAHADTTVQMHTVNEKGTDAAIGTVTITETDYGLVFTPDLKGLTPGIHGFHVHENPSCDPVEKDGKTTPAGAA